MDYDWISNDMPSGYLPDFSATAINPGVSDSSDWGGVLTNGFSRLFDVAAKVYAVKNVPYMQTPAGQVQLQAQNNQRMIFLLMAGAALLLVLKRS